MPQDARAWSGNESRDAASRFWLRVTDWALWAAFLTRAIPETLLFDISIAGIPLPFCVFYGACLAAGASALLSHRKWISGELALCGLLCLYMATVGYFNGAEKKFLAIDLTYFIAIMLGLLWSAQRSVDEIVRWIRWVYISTTVVLLLSCLGLLTGAIPPANEGSRVYAFSIFGSSTLICTLSPLICVTASVGNNRLRAARLLRWAMLGLGTVLMAAVISATRSMMLVWLCSVTATVWLKMSGRNGVIYAVGVLLLSPVVLSTLAIANWENTQIAQRLQSTELDEELRYVELQMMYEDLYEDLYVGKGFGSRFASPIGTEQIAFAPHIGITTLLYKGGVFVFLLVILLPVFYIAALFCFSRGAGARGNAGRLVAAGCLAGVLVNVAQASLSAGWDYQHLFQFAMLFAASRHARREGIISGARAAVARSTAVSPRLQAT